MPLAATTHQLWARVELRLKSKSGFGAKKLMVMVPFLKCAVARKSPWLLDLKRNAAGKNVERR